MTHTHSKMEPSASIETSEETAPTETGTLTGNSVHFTGFQGATSLHSSLCTDSPQHAIRRLQASGTPREKGLLWCLQELLVTPCIPLKELAEFFYGWYDSIGTVTKQLVRGFRNILLCPTYAFVPRVLSSLCVVTHFICVV
jgi:hypothetical protein